MVKDKMNKLFNFKLLFKYERGIILIFTTIMFTISLLSWIFSLSSPDNRAITFVLVLIFGTLSYFIFESILLLERIEKIKKLKNKSIFINKTLSTVWNNEDDEEWSRQLKEDDDKKRNKKK